MKDEYDQIQGGKRSGLSVGPQAKLPQATAVKKLHQNPSSTLPPKKRARTNRK